MRILGVIDLLAGRAVHARAGDRAQYRPVESVAGSSIAPGNALELAHFYVHRVGLRELYVADLDAILGRAPHATLISRLARLGVPLWLDAGVTSGDEVRRAIGFG